MAEQAEQKIIQNLPLFLFSIESQTQISFSKKNTHFSLDTFTLSCSNESVFVCIRVRKNGLGIYFFSSVKS